jgi:hypothetical protein
MRTAAFRLAFGMLVVFAGAIACRQGDPSTEPKTPPNSPIPKIEPPEESKAPPPSPLPFAGDGG